MSASNTWFLFGSRLGLMMIDDDDDDDDGRSRPPSE